MAGKSSAKRLGSSVAGCPRVCMFVDTVALKDPRVMRSASALASVGMNVTIVDIAADRKALRREVAQGITIEHIRMPAWYRSTRFKPWFLVKLAAMWLRALVLLLRIPADVYHSHDLRPLLPSYLAAHWRRKPLIYDAHELPLVDPVVTRWRRLHALATRAVRTLVAGCAAVIVVSPPIVPEFHRRYGGPVPVLVRNLPAYQCPGSTNRIRECLGLPPNKRIALYQGVLLPDRHLDILVRAGKYLADDIAIILLGSGVQRLTLEALIAHENVADRVFMIPAVPYEDLLTWTASADVGLILFPPSHSLNVKYCLPNKLFEYLMSGVPALASGLDAVSDIIKTYGVGRIISSLDPRDIAHAIHAMVADHDTLHLMRKNALAACEREFRWDVEQNQLLALYHHLLGSGAEPFRENG